MTAPVPARLHQPSRQPEGDGGRVDVEQLRGLLEAGKDGDWHAERVFWKIGSTRGQADTWWWDVQDDAGTVALCSTDSDGDYPNGGSGKDRADLIVAAVNALPALLDLIRRQDAALTAVRKLADSAQAQEDRSLSRTFDGSKFPVDVPLSDLHAALALASPDTTQEAVVICDSRGPRIGEEGCPRCRQPEGHDGPHRPAPKDGWGDVTWRDL